MTLFSKLDVNLSADDTSNDTSNDTIPDPFTEAQRNLGYKDYDDILTLIP